MKFKCLKNNLGVTLIELIVVMGIITILGAILMPNFVGMISKVRIKSDIESARVLNEIISLYEIERGNSLEDKDTKEIFNILNKEGLLDIKNDKSEPNLQTDNAEWYFNRNNNLLVIKVHNIKDSIFESLSKEEQKYIIKD